MSTLLISTSGLSSPVVIADLGNRSLTHPSLLIDFTDEYQIETLRDSEDLRAAIVSGDLIGDLDGVAITTGALFDSVLEDFLNKRVSDLETKVDALEKGGRRFKAVNDVVSAVAVPPTEVSGDRYWLDFTVGTVSANWDLAAKGDIVEFDGATWVVQVSTEEGDVAYSDVQNTDYAHVDDGTPTLEKRDGLLEQDATQVPYTPTTAADWDVTPTEVGGALDELADRVETLEGVTTASKKTWTFSAGENGNLNGDQDLLRTGRIFTNQSPFISIITGTIWGISIASRQGTNETFDIQIIVNGVVVHTESIVGADKGFNNGLALAVSAGDEVRARYIKGTSGKVKDVGIEIYGIES